jgi:hypothetical protein
MHICIDESGIFRNPANKDNIASCIAALAIPTSKKKDLFNEFKKLSYPWRDEKGEVKGNYQHARRVERLTVRTPVGEEILAQTEHLRVMKGILEQRDRREIMTPQCRYGLFSSTGVLRKRRRLLSLWRSTIDLARLSRMSVCAATFANPRRPRRQRLFDDGWRSWRQF